MIQALPKPPVRMELPAVAGEDSLMIAARLPNVLLAALLALANVLAWGGLCWLVAP